MTTSDLVRLGERSAALRERALRRTPGGVHSNVRLGGPLVFIERAKGAWLYDVDGRDYVDYLLGQGPNFLGHAPDDILAAVERACRDGMVYGGQHPLEVAAAEAVCEALGWPERIRFGVTGTEQVQAAMRLARAATGRSKIIRFEGHYHGWLDNILVAPGRQGWGPASAGQSAAHLADLIVLPWNDVDAVRHTMAERGAEIAGVITEAMMINTGSILPRPGFLETLRELCDEHGAVLIFDEVISGFRLALGGAVERFGVTPDLATYGKAMAGGWPVAALAGRADLMDRFGTGEVNHSGTFNSSTMAMAATLATITRLREQPPYEQISAYGDALRRRLAELAARYGLPLQVQGLPMALHVSFTTEGAPGEDVVDHRSLSRLDLARYERFAAHLVDHGVWVAGRGIWYVSAAHGDAELGATLERLERAFATWVTEP
jgi:glutamate-1-semialdehyde 2,1-aminomutase